jgi:hypothetical protein
MMQQAKQMISFLSLQNSHRVVFLSFSAATMQHHVLQKSRNGPPALAHLMVPAMSALPMGATCLKKPHENCQYTRSKRANNARHVDRSMVANHPPINNHTLLML